MTFVSVGRTILSPTRPAGNGRGDRIHEPLTGSRAFYPLSYHLPPPPPPQKKKMRGERCSDRQREWGERGREIDEVQRERGREAVTEIERGAEKERGRES